MLAGLWRSVRSQDLVSLLALSSFFSPILADPVDPVAEESGVSAYPFDMNLVSLTSSRWQENQDRTLTYIKWVDVDRLLYNFRANHNLSTEDAETNGGWDAPDFPFRTHFQGHILNAWAFCYAQLGDTECSDRATYFVQALAKCQANNEKARFNEGYVSGFPESEFDLLENQTLSNGNVPYYAIHKTLSGLLDVWRHIGDETAGDVLLSLAAWVDSRTSELTYTQMQTVLETEFGGMNEVLADIYYQTGDDRWLDVAQRFDHAAVFDPLAANTDSLNGLHANTQVPKWIGAAREFKATGTSKYKNIAFNAWNMTVKAHSYSIGGNSQSEHFRAPNAIASYLDEDTCEACNSYNMLKLTRELWLIDPSESSYFDFYERSLLNHLLGQQDPESSHGHITYFTPLNAGGRRGVGPAWGGGNWSTDYDSFWCCQGTSLETNTKLADSIYFYDNSSLYVNLFTPSVLNWESRNIKITQTTEFPVGNTTKLAVSGDGTSSWTLHVRIPDWTSDATITVNGEDVSDVDITPGSYASITRSWESGDTVTVTLPKTLYTVAANDDADFKTVAYGPVILAGDYGDSTLSDTPTLQLNTVKLVDEDTLEFEGTADGETVSLVPFYDAQWINYNVYWKTSGTISA